MLLAYHRLQILCLLPQLWESSPKMLSGFLLILKIELCFSTNPCNVEFSEIAIYFEIDKWIYHLLNKLKRSYGSLLFFALHAIFIALTLMIGNCSFWECVSHALFMINFQVCCEFNRKFMQYYCLLTKIWGMNSSSLSHSLPLYLAIYVSLSPYQPNQMSL